MAAAKSVTDPSNRAAGEASASTQDEQLDEILRAVAHAPRHVPPPEPAHPGDRWGAGGRYVIEARLGRGGMGTVYSATDTLLHRTVALKVLDAGQGDGEAAHRARLLREARIAARFEHERVARVYDVGEHEGALFVAMELVRGVTLRRWMTGRAASADEILDVAGQIAEGLAALHAAGVFHRDLKPENVMLTQQGAVRLLDFGLARHTARSGAEGAAPTLPAFAQGESLAALSGTPGYMAPEQWAGEPLDARVDVFALGVILYELVTGARPFDGPGDALGVAPDFTHAAWAGMPAGLQAITARMLARDPADRFADGAAAREALGAISVTPNAAASDAPVKRTRSAARWMLAGGMALALAAAGAWSVQWARRTATGATVESASAPAPVAPRLRCNAEATALFEQGVEEWKTQTRDIGPWKRAIKADPDCGPAHLRLAIGAQINLLPVPETRAYYADARAHRDRLTEAEVGLLDAIAPWFTAEPDDTATHVRLHALAVRFPDDALIAYLHAWRYVDEEDGRAAASHAIALDPRFGPAYQWLADLAPTLEARRGYVRRCTQLVPRYAMCQAYLGADLLSGSDCAALERFAREFVASNPGPAAQTWLVDGLVANGAPSEAVGVAMEQMLSAAATTEWLQQWSHQMEYFSLFCERRASVSYAA